MCFSDVYMKELEYGTISIDGEIDGIKDLDIGSGVIFTLGETVWNSNSVHLFQTVEVIRKFKMVFDINLQIH